MDRDHEVFISYSHTNRDVAEAVCAKLESHAIPCWMAPRNVLPGEPWGRSIVGAIQRSRAMVVILSSQSNASPQVVREVERAVNHGLVVVPLRIEPVQPTEDLEYFLSSTHWLDALTPDLQKHLQSLYEIMVVQLRRARAVAGPERPAPAAGPAVEAEGAPESEPVPDVLPEAPSVLPAEPDRRTRETADPAPDPAPAEESVEEIVEEIVVPRQDRRSSSIAFILGCLGILLCPIGVFMAMDGGTFGWLLCLIGPAAVFLGFRENSQVVLGVSRARAGSARLGIILGIFETGFMLLAGAIYWIFKG